MPNGDDGFMWLVRPEVEPEDAPMEQWKGDWRRGGFVFDMPAMIQEQLGGVNEELEKRAKDLEAANAEIAKQRDEAEWGVYSANLALTQSAIADGAWPDARERLAKCPENLRGLEWNLLDQEAQSVVCEFRDATSAALSPDGSRVLTMLADSTARLWDAQCNPIGSIMRNEDKLDAAFFSSDGTHVITLAKRTQAVQLWDLQGSPVSGPTRPTDGVLVNRYETSPGGLKLVPGLASLFSPDGTQALIKTSAGVVRIWNTKSNAVSGSPIVLDERVTFAIFDKRGARVLAVSENGTARVWNSKGQPISEAVRHKGFVNTNSAQFSPDGTRIVTTSYARKSAIIWDAETCEPDGQTLEHGEDLGSATFSLDSSTILTGSYDGTARLWDISGSSVGETMRCDSPLWSAVFNRDGTRVLTVTTNGVARLWDLLGRPVGAPLRFKHTKSGAISADGTLLLISVDSSQYTFAPGDNAAILGFVGKLVDLAVLGPSRPVNWS